MAQEGKKRLYTKKPQCHVKYRVKPNRDYQQKFRIKTKGCKFVIRLDKV